MSTFIKQQPQVWCLIFSQCLGPRAQRNLCLLFQLEYVGFARVQKLLERPGWRPIRWSHSNPRDLKNQEGSVPWPRLIPHTPCPLERLSRQRSLKLGGNQFWFSLVFCIPPNSHSPYPNPWSATVVYSFSAETTAAASHVGLVFTWVWFHGPFIFYKIAHHSSYPPFCNGTQI